MLSFYEVFCEQHHLQSVPSRLLYCVRKSWGMANDGEWGTGQYLIEGVKAIKCFQPRMLTPPMATPTQWNSHIIRFLGIFKKIDF